jgi:hypothetical protein
LPGICGGFGIGAACLPWGGNCCTAALQLPSTDLSQRARALNGLASFCLELDDYAANLAYHEEGLALAPPAWRPPGHLDRAA